MSIDDSSASCLARESLMLFSSCDKFNWHQTIKKKLYYAFVDLEKEFDRVPRAFAISDIQSPTTRAEMSSVCHFCQKQYDSRK